MNRTDYKNADGESKFLDAGAVIKEGKRSFGGSMVGIAGDAAHFVVFYHRLRGPAFYY
jgi:hypothetical protein